MKTKENMGKVVLVTGAAEGIGAAVAQAFAESGAIIAAIDRNAVKLDEFVTGLTSSGYQAFSFALDVSNSAAVTETVERIERELGPIEILVNVAGVLRTGLIETLSDEDWTETFAVNTAGVFYMSRSVVQHMVQRRSGSIVTVSSNATGVPRMNMAAYAASKAASTMFTKCLGLEMAQHNIRCNVVSPGSTDTAMQRLLWKDDYGAQDVISGSLESFRLGIPLKKLATPADIADAVLFLAADRARHITMHDLCVDGGATLGV